MILTNALGFILFWLSGLEKKEASMFEMALNSFVISEINLYQSYLKASI